MRLEEFTPHDPLLESCLEEGPFTDKIKRVAIGGALAAGLGSGAYQAWPTADTNQAPTAISQPERDPISKLIAADAESPVAAPAAKVKPTAPAPSSLVAKARSMPRLKNVSSNISRETLLKNTAIKAGITGTELAAFLAQCNHESWDFGKMKEKGSKEYFKQKYDPTEAPKTAGILGNTTAGDGVRYHGRGFIQLTGRDNYRMAGEALNLPLLKHPELAEKPAVAAKIAVWYWKTRVKPNVDNFADVADVTSYINPALDKLGARVKSFVDYLRML